MNNNVEYIKQTVSMVQLLSMYGYKLNRAGFVPCPFHSEKTPSLKVYPNSFCCFGCSTGGDVIKFVMLMERCNFIKACERIDNMFNLNLFKKPTLAQHKQNQKRLAEIKAEKEAREQAEQYEKYAYRCIAAYREWLRNQPQTEAVKHDYEYLERFILRCMENRNIAQHNIKALLTALMTKHKEGGNDAN